jgi:hypothetical protein
MIKKSYGNSGKSDYQGTFMMGSPSKDQELTTGETQTSKSEGFNIHIDQVKEIADMAEKRSNLKMILGFLDKNKKVVMNVPTGENKFFTIEFSDEEIRELIEIKLSPLESALAGFGINLMPQK